MPMASRSIQAKNKTSSILTTRSNNNTVSHNEAEAPVKQKMSTRIRNAPKYLSDYASPKVAAGHTRRRSKSATIEVEKPIKRRVFDDNNIVSRSIVSHGKENKATALDKCKIPVASKISRFRSPSIEINLPKTRVLRGASKEDQPDLSKIVGPVRGRQNKSSAVEKGKMPPASKIPRSRSPSVEINLPKRRILRGASKKDQPDLSENVGPGRGRQIKSAAVEKGKMPPASKIPRSRSPSVEINLTKRRVLRGRDKQNIAEAVEDFNATKAPFLADAHIETPTIIGSSTSLSSKDDPIESSHSRKGKVLPLRKVSRFRSPSIEINLPKTRVLRGASKEDQPDLSKIVGPGRGRQIKSAAVEKGKMPPASKIPRSRSPFAEINLPKRRVLRGVSKDRLPDLQKILPPGRNKQTKFQIRECSVVLKNIDVNLLANTNIEIQTINESNTSLSSKEEPLKTFHPNVTLRKNHNNSSKTAQDYINAVNSVTPSKDAVSVSKRAKTVHAVLPIAKSSVPKNVDAIYDFDPLSQTNVIEENHDMDDIIEKLRREKKINIKRPPKAVKPKAPTWKAPKKRVAKVVHKKLTVPDPPFINFVEPPLPKSSQRLSAHDGSSFNNSFNCPIFVQSTPHSKPVNQKKPWANSTTLMPSMSPVVVERSVGIVAASPIAQWQMLSDSSFNMSVPNLSNEENVTPLNNNVARPVDPICVAPRAGVRSPLKSINILGIQYLSNNRSTQGPSVKPTLLNKENATLKSSLGVDYDLKSAYNWENAGQSTGQHLSRFDEDVQAQSSNNPKSMEQSTGQHLFGFGEDVEMGEPTILTSSAVKIPTRQKLIENLKKLGEIKVPRLRSSIKSRSKKIASATPMRQMTLKEQIETPISSRGVSEYSFSEKDPYVNLFGDPETTLNRDSIQRTYTRTPQPKRKGLFDFSDSEHSDNEEEQRLKPPKRKRNKMDKKWQDELEQFASSFNAECEKVNEYELIIE